jgi:hypothetical protein
LHVGGNVKQAVVLLWEDGEDVNQREHCVILRILNRSVLRKDDQTGSDMLVVGCSQVVVTCTGLVKGSDNFITQGT